MSTKFRLFSYLGVSGIARCPRRRATYLSPSQRVRARAKLGTSGVRISCALRHTDRCRSSPCLYCLLTCTFFFIAVDRGDLIAPASSVLRGWPDVVASTEVSTVTSVEVPVLRGPALQESLLFSSALQAQSSLPLSALQAKSSLSLSALQTTSFFPA